MNLPKVLITNSTIPQVAFELLGAKCELIIIDKDNCRQWILDNVAGVDAIFWATKVKLDKEVLNRAGAQMKIVATMSAGVDHIDVAELRARGIKFGHTPDVLNDAVADIGVLLTLAASRRLHEGRLQIDNGNWTPGLQWMLGQDIGGSTVGIIGLGGIGQAIVRRLQPFHVKQFLYTGHTEKQEGKELGAKFVSLDTLSKESDFVIVACPLTAETTHLINRELLLKMKKTAVLVNVARGEVVDQQALVEALKNGTIFAAGLDVMTPEPISPNHDLVKLPNCVLIPHLGSATYRTRESMADLTAKNILRALGGEEMLTPFY